MTTEFILTILLSLLVIKVKEMQFFFHETMIFRLINKHQVFYVDLWKMWCLYWHPGGFNEAECLISTSPLSCISLETSVMAPPHLLHRLWWLWNQSAETLTDSEQKWVQYAAEWTSWLSMGALRLMLNNYEGGNGFLWTHFITFVLEDDCGGNVSESACSSVMDHFALWATNRTVFKSASINIV